MHQIFFPIVLITFLSTVSAQAQVCSTNSPGGEWSAAAFTCTGGATLATASSIIINHPITISGQTVTLNQQVSISLRNSLTLTKSGSADGVLNLTNSGSSVTITNTGALINGTGGGNNQVLIGSATYAGNTFANLTAQRAITLTATGALPIELHSFEAQAAAPAVVLQFATATETGNSHFNIERSADGRSFEKIGEVRGAGNSASEQQYTFTDEQPLPGLNYYRLEQVDFDGQSTYSPVRSVVFAAADAVLLYPAPVASDLHIRLHTAFAADAQWHLFDLAGRAVGQGVLAAEQTELTLPVGHLPEGGYVLRLVGDQRVLAQQFRKG
jgi:hypothetical protein